MAKPLNGRWQSNVIVDGKRIRKMHNTREEAEAFEKYPDGPPLEHTVKDLFLHGYQYHYLRTKNSIDAKRMIDELIQLLGPYTAVQSITTAKVQDLILKLRAKGNSSGRINRKLATLSKMLTHVQDRGITIDRPKIKYEEEGEGRSRYLTEQEVEQLFSHLSGQHLAFARFLLFTGCRVGETLLLRWDDYRDGKLTLRWDTTKGKKMRSLSLPRPAVEALHYGRDLGWSRPWQGIHYDAFHAAFTAAKLQAGLVDKDIVPHILRHTCASWLVQRGVSLFLVSKWLGHSTTNTTMRYAHLAPDYSMSA